MDLRGLLSLKSNLTHRNKLHVLPNVLTLSNACCGFLSSMYALQGEWGTAAYLIFCAAFFDMLDGRMARFLGLTSYLGAQLDSLADAISFCCAPALLIATLHGDGMHLLAIVPSLLFLCGGIFRLARFNVQSEAKIQQDFFSGLPTPVAALLLGGITITFGASLSIPFWYQDILIALIVGFLAFLMVSNFPFPAFKKRFLIKRYKITLSYIAVCGVVSWIMGLPLLVAAPLSYILGPMLQWCIDMMKH